jgi:hypothetical protein
VELEDTLDELAEQGLGLVAITYDTPEVIRHFAQRVGITYPLLADPDSKIIGAFDILNTNIPEDHEWYGVPFPGTYVVDANGIVKAKYFEQDHRERYTADSILTREFGVAGARRVEVQNPGANPARQQPRATSGRGRSGCDDCCRRRMRAVLEQDDGRV